METISFVCDEVCLNEYLKKEVALGIRTEEVIERSLKRIPMYQKLDTIKIKVTHKMSEKVADIIACL